MDFEGEDPQAVLEHMRESEHVFHEGLTVLFKVDNYDNHLPSGLTPLWRFFNAHRQELYSGDHDSE